MKTRTAAPERRSRIACECLGVTEARVAAAIRSGQACSLAQIAACTEAGSGCTACHATLRALLHREGRPCAAPARASG